MAEGEVKGLRELNRALAELPKNIARNVLRGGVRAAAVVILEQVKVEAARGGKECPDVITGQLKRAIYMTQVRELSRGTRQAFKVGVRSGRNLAAGRTYGPRGSKTRDNSTSMDAFYARFVEFGHWARRGKDGRLSYVWTGDRKDKAAKARVTAAGVKTGEIKWVPPQPFMRPAWEAKKAAALEAMKKYMTERIPQEVAKVRK